MQRMCRISWIDLVGNMQVLKTMQNAKECVEIIQILKLEYLGHKQPKISLATISITGEDRRKAPSLRWTHISIEQS